MDYWRCRRWLILCGWFLLFSRAAIACGSGGGEEMIAPILTVGDELLQTISSLCPGDPPHVGAYETLHEDETHDFTPIPVVAGAFILSLQTSPAHGVATIVDGFLRYTPPRYTYLGAVGGPENVVTELSSMAVGGTSSVTGAIRYSPNPNWSGTDSLTFKLCTNFYCIPGSAKLVVSPVNDPPAAMPVSISGREDTSASASVSWTDPENNGPFSVRVASAPSQSAGTVSVSGTILVFQPARNWNGHTSFTYRVCDGGNACSEPALVTVLISPVNDPPVAKNIVVDTAPNESVTIPASWSDPENNGRFTASIVTQSGDGIASALGTDLTFVPHSGWTGTTSFTYRVSDGEGAQSNVATVSVVVASGWSDWIDAGTCSSGHKKQLRVCRLDSGCTGASTRLVSCSASASCPSE